MTEYICHHKFCKIQSHRVTTSALNMLDSDPTNFPELCTETWTTWNNLMDMVLE